MKNDKIFKLIGIAVCSLIEHGMEKEVKEMIEKINKSQSFEESLDILIKYNEPIREIISHRINQKEKEVE